MDREFDWSALLRAQTDRFAQAIECGELEASVTHCPGWTLRHLVLHLGGVHQWAIQVIETGDPTVQAQSAPEEHEALVDWYRTRASRLIATLSSRPAHFPAWTLDDDDPTVGFWQRRQVHETTIHAWDAEQTRGETQTVDPALAWDGVKEIVGVLYPRQVKLGRVTPLAVPVRLAATDLPATLTLGGHAAVRHSLELRDRAEVILRRLWHRSDPLIEPVDPEVELILSSAVTP